MICSSDWSQSFSADYNLVYSWYIVILCKVSITRTDATLVCPTGPMKFCAISLYILQSYLQHLFHHIDFLIASLGSCLQSSIAQYRHLLYHRLSVLYKICVNIMCIVFISADCKIKSSSCFITVICTLEVLSDLSHVDWRAVSLFGADTALNWAIGPTMLISSTLSHSA